MVELGSAVALSRTGAGAGVQRIADEAGEMSALRDPDAEMGYMSALELSRPAIRWRPVAGQSDGGRAPGASALQPSLNAFSVVMERRWRRRHGHWSAFGGEARLEGAMPVTIKNAYDVAGRRPRPIANAIAAKMPEGQSGRRAAARRQRSHSRQNHHVGAGLVGHQP